MLVKVCWGGVLGVRCAGSGVRGVIRCGMDLTEAIDDVTRTVR